MKKIIPILMLTGIILNSPFSIASEIVLPRTGQTLCYDDSLDFMAESCANSGQDGNWLAGQLWPKPRLTVNLQEDGVTPDGTVKDNLTGLIWLKDGNCTATLGGITKTGKLPWADALIWSKNLASGSCGLNDGSTNGQWRLPNRLELNSLVDAGRSFPSLPNGHPFINIQTEPYWSSTTLPSNTAAANFLDTSRGVLDSWLKTTPYWVWPVRDGQSSGIVKLPETGQTLCYNAAGTVITCAGSGQDGAILAGDPLPSPRFTDNGNGTVTDNLTGLVWLKDANCAATLGGVAKTDFLPWANAIAWSNNLASGSCGLSDGSVLKDWRLPNRLELNSLVDAGKANPSLPTGHPFINVQSSRYWSSTTSDYSKTGAWYVGIDYPAVHDIISKLATYYAWPVRGGQFGTSVITVLPASSDFGNVDVNNSSSQIITISNIATGGASKLQINAITLRGADPNQFNIDPGDGSGDTCGRLTPIIDPGASCTLSVSFSPTTAGAKSATLRVSGSDVNAPNTDIPLTGEGVLPSYTAAITFVGTGGGSVSGSISCSSDSTCLPATFLQGTTVTLIPAPNLTSTFTGWSGACTGTGNCSVTMDESKNVTATFTYMPPVNGTCGSSNGETLTAKPTVNLCASGTTTTVSGTGPWNWNCNGQYTGTNAACNANIQTYSVTFASGGNGAVSGTTSQTIKHGGSAAAVTAIPATGYHFVNWTGTGGFVATTDNPLTVNNVTTTQTVTANFAINPTNGSCGSSNGGVFISAPATYLCSSGTASAVTGIGPWSWSCNGQNGGVNASCSASIDITGPALTLSSLGNGTITNNATLNISGTITDVNGVASLTINNVAVTVTGSSYSYSFTLKQGANTITVTATDLAGNSSSEVRSITYDNTNPSVAITYPSQDISTDQNSITITGTVSDTITTATIKISFNGQNYFPAVTGGTFTQLLTIPAAGTYAITATATDEAGNSSSATRNLIYQKSGIVVPSSGKTRPNLADAMRVLNIAMGITTPAPADYAQGDVAPLDNNGKPKGNGVIDTFDAIGILRMVAGLL